MRCSALIRKARSCNLIAVVSVEKGGSLKGPTADQRIGRDKPMALALIWIDKEEVMVKTNPAAGLHRRWELARIRRYVKRHADCSTPALRQQLLDRGYDPQMVELVLGEGPHAPSRLVPFLLGFGIVLLVNVLVYAYYRDYWLVTLIAEGMSLGGFFVAGDDPMVQARWSWSARAEDLSDDARLRRRQERGVVHLFAYGFAAGALVSIIFSLLV